MQTLNKDLKNRSMRKAYLLYGEEAFLRRSYKKRFRDTLTTGSDDFNYSYFEGKDIDASQVISAADTLPLFAEKRLIIVENSGWFKTGRTDIADYLDNMPDTTVLVFVEEEADKRNKLYKKVEAAGYICHLGHPNESAMCNWAAGVLGTQGKKISLPDMQYFIARTGMDMQKARNELDKLCAYAGDREVIVKADIDAITTVTENNRVYDMVRAITSGKKQEAMQLYADLLTLREPPLRILFLTARQFDQLLTVKELSLKGKTAEAAAAELKIPVRACEGMMRQVRGTDKGKLALYISRCLELEEAVKTGNMSEQLAVELIICG